MGGVEVTASGNAALRALRKRVGLVFQKCNLIKSLSVFHNVLIGAMGKNHSPLNWWPATASQNDQGSDNSVNAVSIKKLITATTGVKTTTDTCSATIIQTRHRVPEEKMRNGQILVLQVPDPDPLRPVFPGETVRRKLHAEAEYTGIWLQLYEGILKYGRAISGADHPVQVEGRYVMNPSPIPRFDNPKLHLSACLCLFGAGREKRIYAVPPYSEVVSLAYEDYPFAVEEVGSRSCRLCGATGVYFDEIFDSETREHYFQCSDSGYCEKRRQGTEAGRIE